MLVQFAQPTLAAFPGDPGQIIFGRADPYELQCVASDGSALTPLPILATNVEVQPAWSADGTRIAFLGASSGPYEVYVMNIDGTGLRRITTDNEIQGAPAWAPDGRIVYPGDLSPLTIANADGTGKTVIPNSGGAIDPAWSADGSHIAFSRRHGTNSENQHYGVFTIRADGSELIGTTASSGPTATGGKSANVATDNGWDATAVTSDEGLDGDRGAGR